MNIEPKIAIACRDKVECKVTLRILENAGIKWNGGDEPTQIPRAMNIEKPYRLYIYPRGYRNFMYTCDYDYLLYSDEPDNFEGDGNDSFGWTYAEASDMFRNQIISERRKYAI
jgi:hypothetical protein